MVSLNFKVRNKYEVAAFERFWIRCRTNCSFVFVISFRSLCCPDTNLKNITQILPYIQVTDYIEIPSVKRATLGCIEGIYGG